MSKKKAGKSKLQPKPEPVLKSRPRYAEIILYVPVVVGLPLFFAWFLHVGGASGQRYLLLLLLAAGCSAWYLRSMETKALGFKAPYLSYLLLYGCILMAFLIIWNYLFRIYISQVDFAGDIFRSRFRNYYAPLYGYLQVPSIRGYLFLLLPSVLFTIYLFKYSNRAIEVYSNLGSIFFFVLFSICMAMTDDIARVTDWMAHYGYFAQGLPFFADISELFRDYTVKMGQLGVHNNHYPPGILLTLKIEELLNFRGLTRLLVLLSTIGTLCVLKETGKIIGGSERCAQLAGFLFIFSPGILVYITADPGYIVLLPASLTLLLFLKGLLTGKSVYAVAMGLVFSVYTLFSFSSGFLALFLGMMFALLWRYGQVRFSAGLTKITASMLVFTAFYVILYYLTGFNLLVCLKEAIQNNTNQMSSGFDDVIRYFFRSTGALLVYLMTAGIPLSYLAIRCAVTIAPKEAECCNLGNLLAIGLLGCLLICGFSGFFFLETERIWLFFTPAFAVAAAFEAERIYLDRGLAPISVILLSSLLLSVVYELCLRPFSWR